MKIKEFSPLCTGEAEKHTRVTSLSVPWRSDSHSYNLIPSRLTYLSPELAAPWEAVSLGPVENVQVRK